MGVNVLEIEFQYFKDHQETLVSQYDGKYLVIIGEQVIGAYESDMKAYEETKKTHSVGTFLIQQCLPGEECYTRTFHSRVRIGAVATFPMLKVVEDFAPKECFRMFMAWSHWQVPGLQQMAWLKEITEVFDGRSS